MFQDAFDMPLVCPTAGRMRPHLVIRQADKPTLAWCQHCFRVREIAWPVELPKPTPPRPQVQDCAAP